MRDRFELRNCGDRFFFILRDAVSREVILTGELYATKTAALQAIEAARVNAALDRRYLRKVSSSSGRPYFVLCSASQEVLATSRIYATALLRNRAIAAVKANARRAMVEDETLPRVRRFASSQAAAASDTLAENSRAAHSSAA